MAHLSSAKSAGTLSIRAGVSPKLLARKSAEKANASPRIEGVEESFPSQVPKSPDLTTAVVGSASTTGPAQEPVAGAPAPAAAVGKLGATAWSEEDESCFQALFAKRKAARVSGR